MIRDWSGTAGSNTTVAGISIAEGCAAANLNDMGRAIMADVANWRAFLEGSKTTAGTANVQTLTSGLSISSLAVPLAFKAKIGVALTNTGATTLALDSTSAKSVKRVDGSALVAGDLTAGGVYDFAYEATADVFILSNPTPAGFAISSLTEDTSPDGSADFIPTYDTSATGNKKVKPNTLLGLVSGLTEDTSPDGSADFTLTYDTSATAPKKVKPNTFLGLVNGLTEDTAPDTSNDYVLTYDASATAPKKVKVNKIGPGASGQTLVTLHPYQNEPPSSNYATAGLRNGHPTLQFDDTTSWAAIFTGVLPRSYAGGGLTVYVHASAIATSGTMGWLIAIERMDDSGTDFDADSFASNVTVTAATVPGTSGQTLILNGVFTSGAAMDSLAAGEQFRLKVARDVANDNAVGNVELMMVEVKET